MDVQAAETDLVTKLTTDLVSYGVRVEAFPDEPEVYICKSPHGAVLIRYNGSLYEDPDLIAVRGKRVNQERQVEWLFTVLYRNLSAHKNDAGSMYTLIEAVRESLTGYTINSLVEAGVMYCVRDEFVGRDEKKKLWEHELVMRHTIPESEAFQ